MSYSIQVSSHPESNQRVPLPFFVRNFDSPEEFQKVVDLCDNKRRIGWWESLIIPVRTNNLENFCKDLFLPGFFNLALKTNDLAMTIILCILTPIYDILTLPIRLITAIPRYFYNAAHPKESHPFYQYLINNGVPAATLSADYVYLRLEEKKELGLKSDQTSHSETFNFIQLPLGVSDILRSSSYAQDIPNQPQLQAVVEVIQ